MQLLCNCLRICSVSSRCSASYFREFFTLYLIFYQISSHFVVPLVVMGGWPSPNCICGLLPNPSPCRPTAPRWLSGWPYTFPPAPKWARGHGRLFPKPLTANLRCLSDQTSHQYLQPLTFEASSAWKISHECR